MLLSRVIFFAKNNLQADGTRIVDLVKAILNACTSYDAASGLSGALAFNNRYFLQVMEGDRELVTRQFLKTGIDPRVAGVTLAGFDEVPNRAFTGWTVAYVGSSNEEFDRLVMQHSVASHLDPSHMTGDAILGLLAGISRLDSPYVQRSAAAAKPAATPKSTAAPRAAEIERIQVTRVVA